MGQCFMRRNGAMFKAYIVVTTTPSSVVSASYNGVVVATGTAGSGGHATLTVKKAGQYTIASNADGAQTVTIEVTGYKQTYNVNVVGRFTLTLSTQQINSKTATTLSVTRQSSPYGEAGTGALSNGAYIYFGDVITITAGVSNTSIYNTATLKINGATFTSGNNYTVVGNATAAATTTVKSYTLTITNKSINGHSAATITVNRTSSPNQGAATGTVTAGGNKIYYGDVLKITVANANSTVYNTPSLTVNSDAFTSGDSHTVTGAVTAVANSSVKSYTLTITNKTINGNSAATITVNRTSSPNQGAATGTVTAGSNKIYYGDVLKITVANANSTIYNAPTLTVNSNAFDSGDSHTVTGAVTAAANTTVKNWKVTITNATINSNTAATVTVNRTSSPNQGAGTGNLATNSTIYYGDVLKVTVTNSNSTVYNTPTLKVNSAAFTSGNSHTVTAAVAAVATSSVKTITLTVQAGAHSTITLARTASTYAGAANNNSLISKTGANGTVSVYYGDTIKWTYSAATNYDISTHTIAGTARASGYSWSATSAVTAKTTAVGETKTCTITNSAAGFISNVKFTYTYGQTWENKFTNNTSYNVSATVSTGSVEYATLKRSGNSVILRVKNTKTSGEDDHSIMGGTLTVTSTSAIGTSYSTAMNTWYG